MKDKRFLEINKKYFLGADYSKYNWQTNHPYIKEEEAQLLRQAQLVEMGDDIKALEVGCGEGANIYHLQGDFAKWVGLDYSSEKVQFAKSQMRNCQWITGDALSIPFRDNVFDFVFCRDVLHHVLDPQLLVSELVRVCKPGGRIVVLEANGQNFIFCIFGILIKHERRVLRNTAKRLRGYLEEQGGVSDLTVQMCQPMLLHRLLFHYRLPLGSLQEDSWLFRWIRRLENILGKFIKQKYWAYILLCARKHENITVPHNTH